MSEYIGIRDTLNFIKETYTTNRNGGEGASDEDDKDEDKSTNYQIVWNRR